MSRDTTRKGFLQRARRANFQSNGPDKPKVRRERGDLQLTDVVGHLTVTRTGQVTAWYLLAPQRWSFRTHADGNSLIAQHAQRLAQLVGRRLHIRVTHRPYPVARWAAALHDSVVNPLPGWDRYLQEEQQRVARLPLADKCVYYGVQIGKISSGSVQKIAAKAVHRQLRQLQQDISAVDRIMSGPGLDARPAQATDMDWLMTRSIGLGLPAPLHSTPQPTDIWNESDLGEWTDGIQWAAPSPFADHILVSGNRSGRREQRYVSVLTLGRMDLPDIPESGMGPWLQRLDQLRFSYELSATIDVRDATEAGNEINKQLDRIRHQYSHHREHGVQPPLSLTRQSQIGQIVEDDISHGAAGLSTRTRGWFRIALSAPTLETLEERISKLKEKFQPSVLIAHPQGQYALAREFIPGEPLSSEAYARRMPVRTLGASLPSVTSDIGDRRGPNLGYTSGVSRRPVMWHPWNSMETRDSNGLSVVLGTQGSGKTALCGSICYHTSMMGVPWVVLDPSGPIGRLCEMEDLRPYSKAINLMHSEPGTLNPYRMIPDPDIARYTRDNPEYRGADNPEITAMRAYQTDLQRATRIRNTLAQDVLTMMLPREIATSRETHMVLTQAFGHVEGTIHNSPRDVIDGLRKVQQSSNYGEHAQYLIQLLENAAETPHGQLIFPAAEGGDDGYQTRHWRLVVFSLQGLALPAEQTPPEEWGVEERLSMPMMHLAAWYAQSRIYQRDIGERKGLWLDEAHDFQRVTSGRELLRKTGRDSRKHNTRALLSTQDGQDALTAGLENWVDSVFVGRTVGSDAQRAALKLLRIEEGSGYEEMLAGLSPEVHGNDKRNSERPREFVFSDGSGRVERITIPLRQRPALYRALNTRPRDEERSDMQANPWLSMTKGKGGQA
ncbi:ATP-binding protein [Streptomyces sp. B-S-A8]|uniref:ATP-binding protein n=1 Tax=Streptomyces solicavernae TaxID=3043614 RepID=A0ABT6S0F5_9ACTN|nr:ATP-binding protein [Streptomyces sp. B-S-A8]MDI3390168.1 ATP-binding protein [Streptomyces sp. B-S-A8]